MKITHLLVCTLPLLMLGCKKETTTQRNAVSEWDKVRISDSGEIFVNQKEVSLSEFAAECQRLKQVGGGAVIYTGDGSRALSPSPAQFEAIHKLLDARVPIKTALKASELD